MHQGPATLPATLSPQSGGFKLRLSNMAFALTALFLWVEVLNAPLRYSLSQLQLSVLIYLPKLLLLVAVVLLPLLRPRATGLALMATMLVILYLLWGVLNLPSPVQAAFGFWGLVPLLFGLWAGAIARLEQWRRLCSALFIVAVAGVFFNVLIRYPWSGESQEILGHVVEVSREWETYGIQRYAGFARASSNAALQLQLFGILLVALLDKGFLKFVVWLVAGLGIMLTTTKGVFAVWLVMTLYYSGGWVLQWPRYWYQLWLVVIVLFVVVMVLLPFSTILFDYDLKISGLLAKLILASLGDRLNSVWPDSLSLLNGAGGWHWWVGRGLGGVGAAQFYYESSRYMPADNFFVYLVVITGIPITLWVLLYILLRLFNYNWKESSEGYLFPMLFTVFAFGVVMSVIELPLLGFMFGFALCRIVSVKNIRKINLTD